MNISQKKTTNIQIRRNIDSFILLRSIPSPSPEKLKAEIIQLKKLT